MKRTNNTLYRFSNLFLPDIMFMVYMFNIGWYNYKNDNNAENNINEDDEDDDKFNSINISQKYENKV